MEHADTIARLRSRADAIKARGATSLFLFGSRVRGDNREDSDLDGFVEYDPDGRISLLDLIAIERIVEEELGVKADLTTRRALHPLLKDQIERDAVRVF